MMKNERCISDLRTAFIMTQVQQPRKEESLKSNIEEEVMNSVNDILSGIFLNICSNIPDMYHSMLEEYDGDGFFSEKNLLIGNISILSIARGIALPLSLLIKGFRGNLRAHYPDCEFDNVANEEMIVEDSIEILKKELTAFLRDEVTTESGVIHPMSTSRLKVSEVKNIMEGWINNEKKEK